VFILKKMEDLFFRLPENIRRNIFHFTEESEASLHTKIAELLHPDESKCEDIDCDKYADVSKFGLKQIPLPFITYQTISNPYFRWSKVRGRNLFQWGNTRTKYPDGLVNVRYNRPDMAYITLGFQTAGSYGKVKTLVAFKGHLSVIKSMSDNDADFFELVTQAFLHDFCSKHYTKIKVPEILFIQQKAAKSKVVDVCMVRGKGLFLSDICGLDLKNAFAHVLKSLWFLQRDVYLMHRDLGSQNVMFDKATNTVTLIDFGMSCLNPPNPKDVSWSSHDKTFFLLTPHSHAEKCTNRSLDVCILMESMFKNDKDPFFTSEHVAMREQMQSILRTTDNVKAKQVFYHKRHGQFTHITKYRGRNHRNRGRNHRNLDVFFMANANVDDDVNPHWWVYNCVEFPMEKWYPENVIGRILRDLPFEYWFALRRNWTDTFDRIAPVDFKVRVKKNATVYLSNKTELKLKKRMAGYFQKCVRHKLSIILVNLTVVTVSPEDIIR